MAQLYYPCSLRQAFNFEKDAQVLVGHLVSIKIGTEELKADITLTTPTDNTATAAVVGAISSIQWEGGYADPVHITCNVSTVNQTKVGVLTHTKMADTTIEFKFNIYQFDQVAKKYYLAFHTEDTAMKGLILKQGGDLALAIDTDNDMTVPSPLNYQLQISIMPQQIKQDLKVAVSDTDKFAKTWGVDVK